MRKPVYHRDHAGEPAAGTPAAHAQAAAPPPPSFARDIRPMLEPFAAPMMWRFDLTDYTAVMANAQTIYAQISQANMPPPPFAPLTAAQIKRFNDWIQGGCNP